MDPEDLPQEAVDAFIAAWEAKTRASKGVTFPGDGKVRAGLSAAIKVMYERGEFA